MSLARWGRDLDAGRFRFSDVDSSTSPTTRMSDRDLLEHTAECAQAVVVAARDGEVSDSGLVALAQRHVAIVENNPHWATGAHRRPRWSVS